MRKIFNSSFFVFLIVDTVKFEFKTDFNDHILLTFRTEMFGFLHELITSYIAEKGEQAFFNTSVKL
jgi:hypothetical protein